MSVSPSTTANPNQGSLASQRLRTLRKHLAQRQLDFFLVPSSDAHQSEYLPGAWQRRAWLTGFTGSMGNALVGREEAWLWADSRYWLQAAAELDAACWQLMRQGAHGVPSIPRHLGAIAAGKRVGFDPKLSSPSEAKELERALSEAGAELVAVADNLVDLAWDELGGRPALPNNPATVWPDELAGARVADKLAELRQGTAALGASHLVMTTLDEIAWAMNIRGSDVDFNPVVIAWAIVSPDAATLFIDAVKVGPDVRAHLEVAGVSLAPYDGFGAALAALDGKVVVDKDAGNQWILDVLDGPRAGAAGARSRVVLARSPVMLPRAKKNQRELEGMRHAHERDAVAVVRFLHWLEAAWSTGLDELSAAARLEGFRAEGERFRGLSFDTIAGFADNGAIVHYRASPATNKPIDDSTLFLLDSGAQYLDGTTDITRTLHLGVPTDRQREHYTRVLKGHLALRRARFPRGTTGTQLDALARLPLWEVGLNYGHGTGHGVGAHLSVHQGPHRISPAANDVGLEPGMIVSNEPGFYLAGQYGIRIENLVTVVDLDVDHGFGPFYGFDDLTLVPYCRRLIDLALLTPQERAEVDAYHARVRDRIARRLPADARHWLERETAPLGADA
ncbi:MAG: aminopeptidase P family protein [Deltaproteobacteria bacterium]|nr:aminopeptidase P family protein [Deltaproteobacteria bacterium]